MSVGLHGGLFTLALFTSLVDPSPMEFVTYQIEMVSPPPAVQAEIQPATEELVVEPPEPAPLLEEEPEQEVVPIEEPDDPEPELRLKKKRLHHRHQTHLLRRSRILERVLMCALREFAVTIRPTTTTSFGRSLTVFGGGVVGTGRLPSSSRSSGKVL